MVPITSRVTLSLIAAGETEAGTTTINIAANGNGDVQVANLSIENNLTANLSIGSNIGFSNYGSTNVGIQATYSLRW